MIKKLFFNILHVYLRYQIIQSLQGLFLVQFFIIYHFFLVHIFFFFRRQKIIFYYLTRLFNLLDCESLQGLFPLQFPIS